jgi:hypothetical protein
MPRYGEDQVTENLSAFPPAESDPAGQPTTQLAREEAANVGQTAKEAGSGVASTAADQAREVVSETSRQARSLVGDARQQAQEQAAARQAKAAQGLHTLAGQLDDMAAKSGESGMATQLAQEAAQRLHGAAAWLEQRQPADLLDEVRDFARRRPGVFLFGAAAAGVVAGRLTRGLAGQGQQGQGTLAARSAGDTGWRQEGPFATGEMQPGYGYGPATGYERVPGSVPPVPDSGIGYEPTVTDIPPTRPDAGGWEPGPGDEPTYRPGQP